MKTAVTKTGKSSPAGADAPETAFCPNCGGTVKLRKRTLMAGGVTYFWRHEDNRRLQCQERSKPVK